jgi:DNA-binding SARP family transcriptional activator/tetratricopeptide (TPR) repeat protein
MQSLSVRVLGEFDVDGVEPQGLGSRKARTLLRLLALARGQAVSADVLAAALWGDAQPAKPADQVAVLVSRLRGVLGRDRLEHGDGGYRLCYDWLDVDELANLREEIERRQRAGNLVGAAAASRVALSLVRGDVAAEQLAGDWATGQLADLDRLVSRVRRLAASALSAAGFWVEAADLSAAAVARDPYDEDALRLLMRANVSGGRVASALAAYADARRRLADELGADPSPETAALHAAILRGEVTGADPKVSAAARLVGRQSQLDRLDVIAGRAHAGALEIVAVVGEAGIGKTSLLRGWAARRAAIGEVVLTATCGPLDRAVPLDALMVAIRTHLHAAGTPRTAEVLAGDEGLLGPLLGVSTIGVSVPQRLADGGVGPATLYAALLRVLQRLAARAPLVIVLDDAHQAGPALAEWLRFVQRRNTPMVVLAGVRAGEGERLPATETIELGPLDRAAAAVLVGEGRVDELYGLSGGHPLLLAELAAADSAELPASLVEVVSARCDELGGSASATLRAAAVIGPRLDLELLAAVLARPVVAVLEDVEQALARRLLVDEDGSFWFRHDLVRAALAASVTATRAALLHREAGRVLARRADADPVEVAEHARRGGDTVLAARSLRAAAARAGERYDHATAESLLDDALGLHEDAAGWLERARVRTLRGHYAAAYEDVERAAPAGAAALEVGAWASYFDRRFDQATQFAQDGELAAQDSSVRARCLTVGGRTRHAAGDLAGAERLFGAALELATGPDRVTASAWLGVVRAHQSRLDEALPLLRPAAREHAGAEHTAATLHALLFTGHVHALAGRPADALESFARYTEAVERRHVPRFAGRGVNFSGWVLRSLGAADEARELHLEALEAGGKPGIPELRIAALEDLAEDRIERADLDAAAGFLAQADSLLRGDLVFGWRLALKLRLLTGRLALAGGDYEQALRVADDLASDAAAIDVPRYTSVARVLGHSARPRLGLPVDLAAVEADLDLLDRSVAIEAWWWTGAVAAELRVPRWVDRAADRVAVLAAASADRQAGLQAEAARRLDRWRDAAG